MWLKLWIHLKSSGFSTSPFRVGHLLFWSSFLDLNSIYFLKVWNCSKGGKERLVGFMDYVSLSFGLSSSHPGVTDSEIMDIHEITDSEHTSLIDLRLVICLILRYNSMGDGSNCSPSLVVLQAIYLSAPDEKLSCMKFRITTYVAPSHFAFSRTLLDVSIKWSTWSSDCGWYGGVQMRSIVLFLKYSSNCDKQNSVSWSDTRVSGKSCVVKSWALIIDAVFVDDVDITSSHLEWVHHW